jgi:hypothetical protein
MECRFPIPQLATTLCGLFLSRGLPCNLDSVSSLALGELLESIFRRQAVAKALPHSAGTSSIFSSAIPLLDRQI